MIFTLGFLRIHPIHDFSENNHFDKDYFQEKF